MTSKQLARTVLDGRKLVIHFGFTTVEGYLCGLDDYHWFVVDTDGGKHLVHKGSAALITFGECEYDEEPQRLELEEVVGPFRRTITDLYPDLAARVAARIRRRAS